MPCWHVWSDDTCSWWTGRLGSPSARSGPSCSFRWLGSTSAFPGSTTSLRSAATPTQVDHLAAVCIGPLGPPYCHSFQADPFPQTWLISTSLLRACESFRLLSKPLRGWFSKAKLRVFFCLHALSPAISLGAIIFQTGLGSGDLGGHLFQSPGSAGSLHPRLCFLLMQYFLV